MHNAVDGKKIAYDTTNSPQNVDEEKTKIKKVHPKKAR
jgi:hypothetical protein